MTPEKPKDTILVVHGLDPRRLPEREKRAKFGNGRGEQKRKISRLPPFGPPFLGLGPCSSGFRRSIISPSGPPPSGAPPSGPPSSGLDFFEFRTSNFEHRLQSSIFELRILNLNFELWIRILASKFDVRHHPSFRSPMFGPNVRTLKSGV